MCNAMVHRYSDQDKNLIFDSQQRVAANMLLHTEYDVDTFVSNLLSDNPPDTEKVLFNNRPIDCLNG